MASETHTSVLPGSGDRSAERVALVVMFIAFLVLPVVVYPVFLMKVMCFALFACAFNLLIGYGGLLSFGHAMFFGSAGYATAHAAKVWGFTPEVAILFGATCACLLGVVAGALAIRRSGIYFAMITLALAQMVFFFCLQAKFTGGEDGIQAVPRGKLFGVIDLTNVWAMYGLVFVIFFGCFLLIHRVVHSPFGQVLKAIRENESRAISLGYNVDKYKLVAFVISATLAGVAGGTKSLSGAPPEPLTLAIDESGESWMASGQPIAGDDVMAKLTFIARGESVEIEIPFVKPAR